MSEPDPFCIGNDPKQATRGLISAAESALTELVEGLGTYRHYLKHDDLETIAHAIHILTMELDNNAIHTGTD